MTTQFIFAPYTYKVVEEDIILKIEVWENNKHLANAHYDQDLQILAMSFPDEYASDVEFHATLYNLIEDDIIVIADEINQ